MAGCEVIVLGLGGVGSAALERLAQRGVRALGIDRFAPPHHRGSSHGRTRIIRQAYLEHPNYVPLLLRAYELWRELEQRSSRRLLEVTGLLQVGPADGDVVRGVVASAERWNLPIERLSAKEIECHFPGFCVERGHCGVLESTAGCLRVEQCVETMLQQARLHGAECRINEVVESWQADAHGVTVHTDAGTYRAERLVIAAGAWAGRVLASLGLPLRVLRKGQFWFRAVAGQYSAAAGCPAFLFETPHGIYYGLPALDGPEVKVAEHSGGRPMDDPLALDHAVDAEELARVQSFAATALPHLSGELTHHEGCLYTLTPDEHFIVDRHPEHDRVVLAAGLSGHGFKFAPVLGEALADLAIDGRTSLPIDFLRCARPALAAR